MIVVSDTSVVSNLLNIGLVDLLHEIFGRVIIPFKVFEELQNSDEFKEWHVKFNPAWLEIRNTTNLETYNNLSTFLDVGESEAIALALELKADSILIDEMTGRTTAENLGLRVRGILGILLMAKRNGLITDIKPLFAALQSNGFWVSKALEMIILKQANEL